MKLLSVQYLRGIAALLVVYAHAIDLQMKFGISRQQNFYHWQHFGAIGVDIFFVISGFIIAFIAQDSLGPKQAFAFVKKRFIRINPSYYFASILALLILVIFHQHFLWAVIKTITILPIFDYGKDFWSPLLYVGWTLGFEWFFYLIYFILIYFSIRKRSIWLISILGCLTLLGLIFPFKEAHYTFITNPIVWEFCFGVFIAYLYKNVSISLNFAILLLSIGMIAFLLNIIYGYGNINLAYLILQGKFCWIRLLYWGMPAALIVFGTLFIEKALGVRTFKSKTLILIGDASYAIYLIHYLFFLTLDLISKKINFKFDWINPDLLIICLVLVATLMGVAYYRFVEKKLIKKFSQLILRQ